MPATAGSAEHSKKRVNRAGEFLRDFRGGRLAEIEPAEFFDHYDVVDWWRGLHAKPLARVNAGPRYYVKKAGVAEPDVTQRLKRYSTIVDKLRREPTMKLSTMEDIAGVRAVLPEQKYVDRVVAELQAQPGWHIRRD